MMFVRIYLAKFDVADRVPPVKKGDVMGVLAQELLIQVAEIRIGGVELEVVDWGFVEHFNPRDLAGTPTTESAHIQERLLRFGKVNPKYAGDMPRRHNCPCTLKGAREHVKKHGVGSLPAKARAWIATVLPDHADSLGIAGIPISVLKACESIRTRRDPEAGSRMHIFEREAQARSDRDAQIRHSRRLKAAAVHRPSSVATPIAAVDPAALDRAKAERAWETIKAEAIALGERMEAERIKASRVEADAAVQASCGPSET